jgi:hypothetical protein
LGFGIRSGEEKNSQQSCIFEVTHGVPRMGHGRFELRSAPRLPGWGWEAAYMRSNTGRGGELRRGAGWYCM